MNDVRKQQILDAAKRLAECNEVCRGLGMMNAAKDPADRIAQDARLLLANAAAEAARQQYNASLAGLSVEELMAIS